MEEDAAAPAPEAGAEQGDAPAPEPVAPAEAKEEGKEEAAAPPAPKPSAPEVPKKTELPVRQYLETTVVPLLTSGMQVLVKERPEDPVAFLVDYLQSHNPKRARAE